jgi:Secretion system C-terminal sorting domain
MKKSYSRPFLLLAAGLFLAIGANAQSNITLTFTHNQPAELLADAGVSDTVCVGDTITIGGNPTATGGTSPFTYDWTPSGALTSATDANPGAFPTTTTTYDVDVTDDRGCTASSSVIVISDSCLSSNDQFADGSSWIIYPNPNNGVFAVELSLVKSFKKATITVAAVDGRVVFSNSHNTPSKSVRQEIKLAGISKGTYVVTVDLDGIRHSRNVIVQ